jgi:acyl dehydratase
MTDEHGLDYIPEHLSEEAKRKLIALTRESEPEPSPVEVNEYLIRHWCESMEDGNPLYLDAEYARSQGHRGIVAPMGTITNAFYFPFRWPWPPGGREPARHIHYDIKDTLGMTVGIIQALDVENYKALEIGDRISVSQRLVSVSPRKKTRLGEGHFWTLDRLYRNQHGELIMRERMTAFGYGEQKAPAATTPATSGGWSAAVEETIQGQRTGYKPPALRDRLWEDVNEGEELPPMFMPITVTRLVYLASATRDFSPQHSDREYAQQRSKTKDIFLNTPANMGLFSRFMTDWGGPKSTVRRMSFAMRGNVCAGDEMTITGKVTKKHIENGEHRVDLEIVISTQEGPVTPCTATLALPSRSGQKS